MASIAVGEAYDFRVRAENTVGFGDWSDTVTVVAGTAVECGGTVVTQAVKISPLSDEDADSS